MYIPETKCARGLFFYLENKIYAHVFNFSKSKEHLTFGSCSRCNDLSICYAQNEGSCMRTLTDTIQLGYSSSFGLALGK